MTTPVDVNISGWALQPDSPFYDGNRADNTRPSGSVTIAGLWAIGNILTATNSLSDPDTLGVFSYQWHRDGVDISLATNSTYTLVADDDGSVTTVTISYTDGLGQAESKTSGGSQEPIGSSLFFDDFQYTANRSDTNDTAFTTAGWNNAVTEPINPSTRGYLYTVSSIPGFAGSFPGINSTRVLCMESAGYDLQFQTGFQLQYGNDTDSIGHVPADVWYQFWIYHPAEVAADTPEFSSVIAIDATYVSATQITIPYNYENTYLDGKPVTLMIGGSPVYTTCNGNSGYVGGGTNLTTINLTDAVATAGLTTSACGHCWYATTYVSSTEFQIQNLSVADRFPVGRAINLDFGTSRVAGVVDTVSYDGNHTNITTTTAIVTASINQVEYETPTQGLNISKFIYPNRGLSYPVNLCTDDMAWLMTMNPQEAPGGQGAVCAGGVVVPCDNANINHEYFACTNTVGVDTQGNGNTGPNLVNGQAIVADTWRLVKIHIDETGTNPNAAAGQATYEQWVMSQGDSAFVKTHEWYGGVTTNDTITVTMEPPFTDGARMFQMPTTAGGTNVLKGNWFNWKLYLDDFTMASDEADLPTYFA